MTELQPKPQRIPAPRSPAEIVCDSSLIGSQFICASRGLDKKTESPQVAAELRRQLAQIRNGDWTGIELRLLNQAVTLEHFAGDCLLKAQALLTSDEILKVSELCQTLGHLALRSQEQSRRTISTLAEIRNPRKTTFVKGDQHNELNLLVAENLELRKRLEATNALEFAGTEATVSSYETVETVGKINRSAL